MIVVVEACKREVRRLPRLIREDLADALARLNEGHALSMPLSRPMPSIAAGVHELRLKDRSGAYRTVYALRKAGMIYVLHAFKKATRTTPKKNIDLAKQRLSEIER